MVKIKRTTATVVSLVIGAILLVAVVVTLSVLLTKTPPSMNDVINETTTQMERDVNPHISTDNAGM